MTYKTKRWPLWFTLIVVVFMMLHFFAALLNFYHGEMMIGTIHMWMVIFWIFVATYL